MPSQSTPSPRLKALRSMKTSPRVAEPEKEEADPTQPKRASTFQKIPDRPHKDERDAFESRTSEDLQEAPRASVDLDDLPIELCSLTDSFIESLAARVNPSPPNIDNLKRRFQDFYETAAQHIQNHISSVALRQKREQSSAPYIPSRASAGSILRAKAASLGSREKYKPPSARNVSDQRMLTAEEFADRKRAKQASKQKERLYQEAVERRLCEGIYERIYRHHTTQDEDQDHKLRSKTAALAVVGIGPADLGVLIGDKTSPESATKTQDEVKNWLEGARKELKLMNESRYPLGKLNRLKAAYRSIIDTLSHFYPSSSADELMPMLIYTLITMPPDDLNIISDVNFIHRFRWESKLNGEAAYCLTSLEAAASFLETVDLSTLRADEAPSGPIKSSSRPGTPRAETFPPAYSSPGVVVTGPSEPVDAFKATSEAESSSFKASPSPMGLRATAASTIRNRRFSDLVNTPAQIAGAASDAVDQSFKNISNSLGDSYKFLMSKLREQQPSETEPLSVPKTLDDARKLIGTPPLDKELDDDGSPASLASPMQSPEDAADRPRKFSVPRDDKILNLIGGRKLSMRDQDHSLDSTRSVSASMVKKVQFASSGGDDATLKDKENAKEPTSFSNPALIGSMRSIGNSLNPISRLSGIGGFRAFGKINPTPAAPMASASKGVGEEHDLATAFPDLATALPPKEVAKIDPPRFTNLRKVGDLRFEDIPLLFEDYKRLVKSLEAMGAFKERSS